MSVLDTMLLWGTVLAVVFCIVLAIARDWRTLIIFAGSYTGAMVMHQFVDGIPALVIAYIVGFIAVASPFIAHDYRTYVQFKRAVKASESS
jgi:hypothetical protein